MSKATRQKQKPEKTEPPIQDPRLGDLTPEFIQWHEANHSAEEHRQRYFDRIPHEYAEQFGIHRV